MDAAAKRISSARRRANLKCPDSPRGVASDYLRALSTLKPQPVGAYNRVSSGEQNYAKNLKAQIAYDRQLLISMGYEILMPPNRDFAEIGSGQRTHGKLNRPVFADAIKFAKKHGIPLVAESTDRFIRAWDFDKHNQGAIPTVHEFELLMEAADGVPLYTICHPDADWKTVRAFQTGRGRAAKGRKGGRPPKPQPGDKKRSREALWALVERLTLMGLSSREIGEIVDRHYRTVANWQREIRNGESFN